jgi:hypothetical protein
MADASHGWYPDPWSPAHHRYWTGESWSASTFPHGPATEAVVGITDEDPPPPAVTPSASRISWLPTGRLLVAIALVGGLLVGFLIAFTATSLRATSPKEPSAAPPPAAPDLSPVAPPAPPAPTDPAASALSALIVHQGDLPAGSTVQLIPGGSQVTGQPTLDLCNGTFGSESARTARLQVSVSDAQGNDVLSTEAVLYKDAAATAQGFTELRAAAAACPTKFNPAPDGSWPAAPTVERLAFDFTSPGPGGQSQHNVAVYLRRGRALMGIYFYVPDGAQMAVGGQTTIPAIVNIFATRMAQLPISVTG